MAQILRATFQDVCAENLVVNSCLHFFSLSLFFFERGGREFYNAFLKVFYFEDSSILVLIRVNFPPEFCHFLFRFPFLVVGRLAHFGRLERHSAILAQLTMFRNSVSCDSLDLANRNKSNLITFSKFDAMRRIDFGRFICFIVSFVS